MNYLAHLRLSKPDAESMVGNLMGDFRKYLGDEILPEKVRLGIENHMQVDRFTDSSDEIRELKLLFSSKRRRFAGIIIDVLFDHFLARYWRELGRANLDDFVELAHANLARNRHIMPRRMQDVMDYMIRQNWLLSYVRLEGIDEALNRMSARIRFENSLAGAIEEIQENYEILDQGFLHFFPRLVEHIETDK